MTIFEMVQPTAGETLFMYTFEAKKERNCVFCQKKALFSPGNVEKNWLNHEKWSKNRAKMALYIVLFSIYELLFVKYYKTPIDNYYYINIHRLKYFTY